MKNSELFYKVMSFMNAIANVDNNYYDDVMFMYDEKLMSYSVSIVGEIIELLENGYSYDEIKKLIMECDYQKAYPELTDEEVAFLRKDALKMLNIRNKIYMEEKNIKKKIK